MAGRPNFEEMKKIIKDADMYEENMSRNDIESICKIINQSKREVESGSLSESQEELLAVADDETSCDARKSPSLLGRNPTFNPKTWSSTKLKLSSESTKVEQDDSNEFHNSSTVDSMEDATKCCFGYMDMIESTKNELSLVSHEAQFIPIQHTDLFLEANDLDKAKILYAYHSKMNKMKAQFARNSFFPAPLKNPITVEEFVPSWSNSADGEETYISRSGRQSKRKVYYDQDEDSNDGTAASKKTKNTDEQEWPCRTKIPTKKTDLFDSKEVDDFENTIVSNEEAKSTLKSTENTKSFSRARKLTNAEIIQKSSLFSDTPPKLTRSEIMFDKLAEDNRKKEKEAEVMESFQKSLNIFSEVDDRTELDVINVEDEEPVRRRVVPPPPIVVLGRRPINTRKKGLAPLDIKSRKMNTPNTSQDPLEIPTSLTIGRKTGPSKRISEEIQEFDDSSTASTSRGSSSNIVPCPICGVNFPKRKIAEHASSCGDEPVLTRTQKISRICCQICDAVLPISTEYEVHVKQCIDRKKQEDSLV